MFLTKQSIFSGKLRFIVLVAGLTGVLFGSNVMAEDPVPAGSEYVLNSILEIEPPMSERACFDSITTANERLITACIGTDDPNALEFEIEANIFEKNASGEFEQIQKILLPAISTIRPAIEQNISVKADGSWFVVAVPEERGDSFPNNGAVYIYKQAADGISYEFAQKLLPQVDMAYTTSDGFGIAIDIELDRLIVKSAVENATSGFLYNYQFDGISWILQNKIALDNGYGDAYLKQNLVLDGETIYVSTNKMNQFSGVGEIHIFEYDSMMGEWMFKQVLAVDYGAGAGPGYFGQEFVVEGNAIVALVSDVQVRSEPSAPVRGKLAVFSRPDQYAPWEQTGEVLSPGIYPDTEGFGLSLRLKGDELLVGAPKANNFIGTVYQYTFNAGSWNYIKEVLPAEVIPESGFGDNILGINSTSIIVGAPGKELWQQGEYYPGYGYVLSTEVAVQDTDGDGMPDQWEIDNGLDPYYVDAGYDFDGDSLTNLEEYTAGLNPQNYDTDSDGMSDGWEVQNGLNALEDDAQLDSDEDGVSNLDEFTAGTNPNDSSETQLISFSALDIVPDSYGDYYLCDLSSDGKSILADGYAGGEILVWKSGLLKQIYGSSAGCGSISDNGKIALNGHMFNPVIIDDRQDYEWISYPSGFNEGRFISSNGEVVVGRFEGEAAIWDGQQVMKIFENASFSYASTFATGVSYDGNTVAGNVEINEGQVYTTLPFIWEKDTGLKMLECDSAERCYAWNISASGEIAIGEIYTNGHYFPVWWDSDGSIHVVEQDNYDKTYSFRAVSSDGKYIFGETYSSSTNSPFIWDRETNSITILKDWIAEREALIGSSVGDYQLWDLGYIIDASADGSVLIGKGTDPQGKERHWVLNINRDDKDSDGIDDLWELTHGLSPENPGDAELDFDGDSLSNKDEYLRETDINNADTDQDGIDDGLEVGNGLDPRIDDANGDLDGDSVSNIDEIKYGTDLKDPQVYPHVILKGLELGEYPPSNYFVCDISASGQYILGNATYDEYGGYYYSMVWNDLKLQDFGYPADDCTAISDGGVIATRDRLLSPIELEDHIDYESIDYPQGFEYGQFISADGQIIAGRYEDEAAIWNGEEVIKVLAEVGFSYRFSDIFGMSSNGSVIVGFADVDDGESYKATPFRWESGVGAEQLECRNDDDCFVHGISADGNTVIGDVYRYGESYPAWWDKYGSLHLIEGVVQGEHLGLNAVSKNGEYIFGTRMSSSGVRLGAVVWEKETNSIVMLQDWLIERANLLDSPVGDLSSWQLNSVVDISADATVIVGKGINPEGEEEHWVVKIIERDEDGDGIEDFWELTHGLSPQDSQDAEHDFDGDGLTNKQEYLLRTNLNDLDTDSDGIDDGIETDMGLDPLYDDSEMDLDDDGIINIDEILLGTDPNDAADFPQILFKKLTIKDPVSGEYEACDISPNGKFIYGKAVSDYMMGVIWEDGKFKGEAPSSSKCGSVSDDGKLATSHGIFVYRENYDYAGLYEWVPHPEEFSLEDESIISGDGTVVAGRLIDQAAIWDGSQVIELLDGLGIFYTSASGVSFDGSVVAGSSTGLDEMEYVSKPFRWHKGSEVEFLQCGAENICDVFGLSDDGSTTIGTVYSSGKSYGAWWDINGNLHTIEIPDDDRELVLKAVSNNGVYIVGELRDGPYAVEAIIWEKKTGSIIPFQSWLMEQEYQLEAPIGDFHSWQLTSVTGISADGTVISGNGIDPQGNKSGWIVSIKLKDFDADGMPDTWEMENGLDPYYPDADIDFDFDGLDNLAEYTAGTDPQQQDTDGDMISDGLEVEFGLNPLDSSDAEGDLDEDGLSNRAEIDLGTNLIISDTDDDTMLDGWEVQYGLNPIDGADATIDADSDGLTNVQEHQNSTNPIIADTDADGVNDGLEIQYGFDPLNDQSPNDIGDMDSDGLGDKSEFALGTDPQNSDTDGDTMSDGWEVQYGLNPVDGADANVDADSDGLTNVQEHQNSTNPIIADTDADGVNDGLEIQYGFDPLNDQSPNDVGDMDSDGLGDKSEFALGTDPQNPDSDGDTMPDGWEVEYGLNPTSSADTVADEDLDGLTNLQEHQNSTNPIIADTDADGIPDGAELGFGLNPLDPADAALDADGDGMSNLEEYTKGFDPKSANQSPEVSITLPTEDIQIVEGASVELSVEANDAEDGVLTSAVAWSSDLDGELGDGAGQTVVLSVGVHNVTATVVDSFGAESSDQVVVEVLANQAPVVTITQPTSGAVTPEGTFIDFAANASDTEDGDLSAAIAWSSSIDGALGTGTGLSLSLSVGTHVISATSEDSHGAITTSEVTLIVEPFVATEFPAGDSLPELWTTDAAKGWAVDFANAAEGEKSLRSGAITHNESSTMTVSGDFAAGEVTFQHKVSSEAKYDFLRFYDNGVKVAEWAGNLDWQQYSYSLPAGEHTLVWAYEKDSSASKYEDSVWIDAVSLPDFTPISDAEKFVADGQIPQDWTTTSPAWTVDSSTETIDGVHSLRSGDITHRESSAIEVTRDIAAGDMTFYYKVSSEAWYDYLYFYIDGEFVEKWTGDVSWTQQRYTLSAGTHTFKWVYMKDHSVDKGEDAAWIDKVVFPE